MHKPAKSFARAASFAGVLLLALWLPACQPNPVPLNSERIEQRFGSYGIEVLSVGDGIRRANLYSVHDGERVCRTYAVVRVLGLPAGDSDPVLRAAHEKVQAGASLGATFEAAGWQVSKATRYVGALPDLQPPPDWLGLMGIGSSRDLALHVYRLFIQNGKQTFEYADIIEVHHPQYLNPRELAALFPADADEALAKASRDDAVALLTAGG